MQSVSAVGVRSHDGLVHLDAESGSVANVQLPVAPVVGLDQQFGVEPSAVADGPEDQEVRRHTRDRPVGGESDWAWCFARLRHIGST